MLDEVGGGYRLWKELIAGPKVLRIDRVTDEALREFIDRRKASQSDMNYQRRDGPPFRCSPGTSPCS